MWVIRHSIVNWDCSKIQTLETLLILHHPRGDFCVSSEVEHSFLQVGSARNKLQYHTVQQNLKLSLWMLLFAWTEYSRLIFGTWLQKSCILLTFWHGETRRQMRFKASTPHTNTKTKRHGNRDNDELSDVDHVVTGAKPSHFEAMLLHLTTKQ